MVTEFRQCSLLRFGARNSLVLLAWGIFTLLQSATPVLAQSASAPLPGPLAPPSLDPRDLSGVWWTQSNDPDFHPLKGAIPFTSAGRKIFANTSAGLKSGTIDDPSLSRCLLPGPSRAMAAPYPLQIVQTQDQVTLLLEAWHAYRAVYLQAKHTSTDDLDPTFMGESIGHWEGDTLVIDTVGLKDNVWLDASGLPHSDQLHIIEHVRKLAGGVRLADLITFQDSKIFTRPWTARRVYEWRPDIHLTDYVCGDRNRDISWAGRLPKLPPAIAQREVKASAPPGAVDLSGVWRHKARGAGAGGGEFRSALSTTTQGSLPPMLPWAQASYDRFKKAIADGHPIPTTVTRCLGFGVPGFWTQPYPYQFLQTADLLVVLSEADHQYRIFYLNQPHPQVTEPTWSGNTIGHWEGDTLVAQTVGQNDRSYIDGAGIPKTEALVLTEHLRLTNDGKTIENKITFDDPGTYSQPWDTIWPLDRMPAGTHLLEYACAENERDSARFASNPGVKASPAGGIDHGAK